MAHFHLVVIGGGSGGIACAKRAAGYGAKVAVCEFNKWGGTCVNVGCVPKKMMWWCSTVKDVIDEAHHYGHTVENKGFSWEYMKSRRDFTINRLNGIYQNGLNGLDIKMFNGYASFLGKENDKIKINVEGNGEITAEHVVIAPGGYPTKLNVPGEELTINSDDFFWMEEQPKKCAVIGAGYIAIELAQVLEGLGTETHLFFRKERVLRSFDTMIQEKIEMFLNKSKIHMNPLSVPESFEKKDDGIYYTTQDGKVHGPFDTILVAAGRKPMVEKLGLDNIAVEKKPNNYIIVDEYQNTSCKNVYALGDVCGNIELTPMAIAAGRRLGDRVFGGIEGSKADFTDVPTVVFTHPPIGTIGLTEEQAVSKYGQDNIEIYSNVSVNLYYNPFNIEPTDKPRVYMKLICNKADNERVVGLHCIGMGCDELLQGFGIAFKLGATKTDFDRVVAIHPSAAEEMVTMVPWGMTKTQMAKTQETARSKWTQ